MSARKLTMQRRNSSSKNKSGNLTLNNKTVGSPKVVAGDPFTENDVQLAQSTDEAERRARARTINILVIAIVVYYGVYLAHEWWVGNSLSAPGLFLQSVIFALIGWCIGKSTSDRASP